jgi:hypothetical protein
LTTHHAKEWSIFKLYLTITGQLTGLELNVEDTLQLGVRKSLLTESKQTTVAVISVELITIYRTIIQPRQRSRYSDWLRAGRSKGPNSSPRRPKNFNFSITFKPALGSIHHLVQRALFPGVKRKGREANHSPPTSAEVNKT